ncbi:MAG: flavodoxin family protein [Thermodesulfobacteriota bacterium]
MRILGVSGSAIKESNTDRALKHLLEATGMRTEFIKLSDYDIRPCTACLGCIESNQCILKDDGVKLAEKAFKADALVVAGFTPYSTLDSRTKMFLERLYPLRHRHGLMGQKPGAAIVTSCVVGEHPQLPPAGQLGLDAIRYFMMEEGMNYVGGAIVPGNVPCLRCGENGQCQMSAIPMIHGPEAEVGEVEINDIASNAPLLSQLEELAQALVDDYYKG